MISHRIRKVGKVPLDQLVQLFTYHEFCLLNLSSSVLHCIDLFCFQWIGKHSFLLGSIKVIVVSTALKHFFFLSSQHFLNIIFYFEGICLHIHPGPTDSSAEFFNWTVFPRGSQIFQQSQGDFQVSLSTYMEHILTTSYFKLPHI